MSDSNSTRSRTAVRISTISVGIVLASILFAIANYFGWKYHKRFDWTETKLYSLSEKSLNIVGSLDQDIEAVVFLNPADELYGPVTEILSRYEAASPRIGTRSVDAQRNIIEAQDLIGKYALTNLEVVVLDRGDDRRVIERADLAEYDYSGAQYGQAASMTAFKGEQRITSAILELAESRKPKILFTTGHGELSLDDRSATGLWSAQDLLGRDNFELEEWGSLGKLEVPEGTDLVVVAGPTNGFVEPEISLLRSYLDSGGRLLVLLDPTLNEQGGLVEIGLTDLLAEYGVEVGDDLVVDPANPLPFFGAETIFVSDYGIHPLTRSLMQAQAPVIIPLARSVGAGDPVDDLDVVELLRTTAEGWGETDLANLDRVEKSDSDLAGPVPIGVAVTVASGGEDPQELETEDLDGDPGEDAAAIDVSADGGAGEVATDSNPMRLVVIGDSDFVTDGQLPNAANATLFADMMNWLVERESLLGIPPKTPEESKLNLTRGQLWNVTLLVMLVLPGLAVILGIWIYLRRRR